MIYGPFYSTFYSHLARLFCMGMGSIICLVLRGVFYSGVSSVIACMSLCTVVSVSQERQYMVLLLARYVPCPNVSQIYV